MVCTPKGVKETFFFDRYYDRGMHWYLSHFRHCNSDQIACEVAPTYFDAEEAPSRIAKECPGCRIICTLREPASRTFSLYLHMQRYGMINLPFKEALSQEPRLLSSSQYFRHVRRWIDVFGRKRVKVMIFDDMLADREAYIADLYSYVGLPWAPIPDHVRGKINQADFPRYHWLARIGQTVADRLRSVRAYWLINLCKQVGMRRLFFSGGRQHMPTLNSEQKRWLQEYVKEEVTLLEDLIGRDLSHWRPKRSSTFNQ